MAKTTLNSTLYSLEHYYACALVPYGIQYDFSHVITSNYDFSHVITSNHILSFIIKEA